MKFALKFEQWLICLGANSTIAEALKILVIIAVMVLLAVLINFIARKIIIAIVVRLVKKSKTNWDDIMLENKVFHRFSHLAPAVVVYYCARYAFADMPEFAHFIFTGVYIYIVVVTVSILVSFFKSLNGIYQTLPAAKDRSVKGYIQVLNIIVYFVGGILVLSILLGKNPGYFLTGLGAAAAILLLIFKDTILGLTAGIQLSANNMIKPGDWIAMPSKNADGIVTEITLNTIKVQNWDKSITMIPAYSMVSEAFVNWRGLDESGVRRIKRTLSIDMKTIKTCPPELLKKFERIQLLAGYIKTKQEEFTAFNQENNVDLSMPVNGRRLTNIGTFRKYVELYLTNNPNIRTDLTFMVHLLEATPNGLPLEIYAYSNLKNWAQHEAMLGDIIDHLLAVLPEFELSVYQNPTGDDFKRLVI